MKKSSLITALAFGALISFGLAQKAAINVVGGFQAPESILVDSKRDEYLVSNVNGPGTVTDNNGFISRVAADGKILDLKWIEGGKGVTLNAPKGMALVGNKLYVTDIDVVRVFSRTSKHSLATIKLPGTTFLNDLTSDAAGNVYVSDSGLTPEFKPNGTDAIYKIDSKNKVSLVGKGATLALPNGLFSSSDGTVVVAPFGSKNLYSIAADGKQNTIATLPGGSLDGVEFFDGAYYVSSWETSSIYKIKDGAISVVIDKLPSPADIGIDAKRGQLLVPLLNENRLVFQPL